VFLFIISIYYYYLIFPSLFVVLVPLIAAYWIITKIQSARYKRVLAGSGDEPIAQEVARKKEFICKHCGAIHHHVYKELPHHNSEYARCQNPECGKIMFVHDRPKEYDFEFVCVAEKSDN